MSAATWPRRVEAQVGIATLCCWTDSAGVYVGTAWIWPDGLCLQAKGYLPQRMYAEPCPLWHADDFVLVAALWHAGLLDAVAAGGVVSLQPGQIVHGMAVRQLPIGSQVRAGSRGGVPLLWQRTGPVYWERREGEQLGPDWTAEFADDLPVEIVRVGPATPSESSARASHGGEAVLLPEESAPVVIHYVHYDSLMTLVRGLRPKDEGTCVWCRDDGTVSLFAEGGQLVGRVVRSASGLEVRFNAPVGCKVVAETKDA